MASCSYPVRKGEASFEAEAPKEEITRSDGGGTGRVGVGVGIYARETKYGTCLWEDQGSCGRCRNRGNGWQWLPLLLKDGGLLIEECSSKEEWKRDSEDSGEKELGMRWWGQDRTGARRKWGVCRAWATGTSTGLERYGKREGRRKSAGVRTKMRKKGKFCAPNWLKRPRSPSNSQSRSVHLYSIGMSKIDIFSKMFDFFNLKNWFLYINIQKILLSLFAALA